MKISEAIKKLQDALEANGDLELVRGEWDDWSYYRPLNVSPKLVACKPHCGGYTPSAGIDVGGWPKGPRFREPYLTEIRAKEDILVIHI